MPETIDFLFGLLISAYFDLLLIYGAEAGSEGRCELSEHEQFSIEILSMALADAFGSY